MAFISLGELLNRKIKKIGLNKYQDKETVLKIVNSFLKEELKFFSEAKAKDYKNGILSISCQKSVISSQIRMSEEQLRQYLKKHLPTCVLKRIKYSIE